MLSDSARGQKVYINGLCVSGNKIKLSKPVKSSKNCYAANKLITVDQEVVFTEDLPKRRIDAEKRESLKLKVTDYKNLQVCNKQLKQIYETVEIQDFERILGSFYVSDVFKKQLKPRDDVLTKYNVEEIYQEFFGQYYDHLNNVINSSK